MYVVVGLGNPGRKYEWTRHNVGFDVIDCLCERNNINIDKIKFKGVYGEKHIKGEKVIFIKPQTYMNNSGESVRELKNFYKINTENIIVIYDDIDIDLGSIRIRKKGSAGSHNGMKSIIYHLQDDNFPRVRIGIGRPQDNQNLIQFVLGKFNKENRKIVNEAIKMASKAIEEIIIRDIDKAMNKYNGK